MSIHYNYRRAERHNAIRNWLMANDDYLTRAARLHDRLQETADRMDPQRGFVRCGHCGEVKKNPKRHECPSLDYMRQAL